MSDQTKDKVLSIIANIKKNHDSEDTATQEIRAVQKTKKKSTTSPDKKNSDQIRGKPKSGRFWKSQKEKFSTINKTKGLRQDFEKKTALRIELKKTKELSKQVLEELKQKESDRKERRRQNIKRAEENKRKSEVVQVITNSAKLKRMKKKHLRFVQKRDTNKEVEAAK